MTAERGWRVTVVATGEGTGEESPHSPHGEMPCGSWEASFAALTRDVFCLSAFVAYEMTLPPFFQSLFVFPLYGAGIVKTTAPVASVLCQAPHSVFQVG
eukprot:1309734-Pyramimonas_sp.AAC.1